MTTITSQPSTDAYRDGWDGLWGRKKDMAGKKGKGKKKVAPKMGMGRPMPMQKGKKK